MTIKEILLRYKYIKKKIELLDLRIKQSNISIIDNYDDIIKIKETLLTKLQSHKVLLNEQNSINCISINDNSISVNDAVAIRNTLEKKILTLIKIAPYYENTTSMFIEMDKLQDELFIIDGEINLNDSITEWKNE